MGSHTRTFHHRDRNAAVLEGRRRHDSTVLALSCHTHRTVPCRRSPGLPPSCLSSAPHFFPSSDVRDAILSSSGFSSNPLASRRTSSIGLLSPALQPSTARQFTCLSARYISVFPTTSVDRSQNRVLLSRVSKLSRLSVSPLRFRLAVKQSCDWRMSNEQRRSSTNSGA